MYIALLLLVLGCAVIVAFLGFQQFNMGKIIGGTLIALAAILFFWFLGFWGELLWFAAVGYARRFWTVVLAKLGFTIFGMIIGWIIIYLLTSHIPREKRYERWCSKSAGMLIGGTWGFLNWDIMLRYVYRISTNLNDPIIGKDTGFYLFVLPFYDILFTLLLLLSIVAVATAVFSLYFRVSETGITFHYPLANRLDKARSSRSLYLSGTALLFVLAWGKYLNRYHLMYSSWGAVFGPGWTDVHIRLYAYVIVTVLTILFGCVLIIPPLRMMIQRSLEKKYILRERFYYYELAVLGTVGAAVAALWFITLLVIPGLVQWLRVEPNEITLEKSYISNNIRFTRYGFGLNRVEEREYPASEYFTREMVARNQNIFSNIRLWDVRALDAVYKQFQEIRLYYEFENVDIDRYTIGDAYRQVMISARELNASNLPEQSQTFVNQRFKYTHGHGLTLTTVSTFRPDGSPNLLVKDIPPKSDYPELEVSQPRIYYGGLTSTPVVVNSSEEEFDYPSGDQNVYNHYDGTGGVPVTSLWRKFLFGWKFDGTRFFLSGYPTPESRIMFHRQIRERVTTLAPFLQFDSDPYIVLAEGNLYWIIDCYTTSEYFPYSEPFSSREAIDYREGTSARVLQTDVCRYLDGVNYIRNSVKVVVDAFNGTVDFYIFDKEDPIIQVWQDIFSRLFKYREDMPEALLAHVRYPADQLRVQGLVYTKYHMSDPAVFYNQEDLWIRATEKYYDRIQPVDPYYIMWELPGSDKPEFVLMLPFTPKNRQVLIGWIAGMCDPENYGRFLAYKFPKEKRVLGTQQVETKIDQDRFLSAQLTLWDQRGSKVIRGNVLVIPIEETLLYVEPIYLQAETAAYPEIRLVAVMHNDNLSYGETFDEALQGLFDTYAGTAAPGVGTEAEIPSARILVKKAGEAFEAYVRLSGEKKFHEAAEALETLQETLQNLKNMLGNSE